jgi:hypothetical protein
VIGGEDIEVYQPNSEEYEKKVDLLYLKGIVAEKMLVYEDESVKIGCIRSISNEWRQATLKLYIGNKSGDKEVNNILFTKELQFMNIRDEDKQPFTVEPNE